MIVNEMKRDKNGKTCCGERNDKKQRKRKLLKDEII